MEMRELWNSTDPADWQRGLAAYENSVKPAGRQLEDNLNALSLQRVRDFSPAQWYAFLRDEYFRWKYTAPNRYKTTTNRLTAAIEKDGLGELDELRKELLAIDGNCIFGALDAAMKIPGLGTAGASGLLALMYPSHFATVDQFVVKALQRVERLPEEKAVGKMSAASLSIGDGALLIKVMRRKAAANNQVFGGDAWTPRKIDMVLWAMGH